MNTASLRLQQSFLASYSVYCIAKQRCSRRPKVSRLPDSELAHFIFNFEPSKVVTCAYINPSFVTYASAPL